MKVLRYEPRTVLLEVDAAGPAFLVASEAHYPGWRAFMDGREVPLYYTNAGFRGLPVPAGKRNILMRFAPPLFWRAGLLSAVAWMAALVAIVLPWRRRKAACLPRGSR